MNVRLYSVVLCLACGAILATPAPWAMLSAETATIAVRGGVTTVPVGGLIRKPANFFDLEGTTVTFTPNGADGYAVAVSNLNWHDPTSGPEIVSRELGEYESLTVALPFPFPFAGRTWARVYANTRGNLSFRRPERMNHSPRDHDTMRSVAAAMDSRSAAGLEAMIAVLWAQYENARISVASNPDGVVITWRAVRFGPYREHGYTPLGQNLFQARLYASGVIELAYRAVPERDGIVGLFPGLNAGGRTVDTFDDARGDVTHGVLDITEIEWSDSGSVMLVRMTLAEDVPEQVAEGEINYRVFLHFGDSECWAGIAVTTSGRRTFAVCDELGGGVGYRVHGATLEIPISKTFLSGLRGHFSWDVDAVWWGLGEYDQVSGKSTVDVNEPNRDLDAPAGTGAGNLFEVFHYPSLRSTQTVLSSIHERVPANDEIVVTFTDFRMDHFGNAGAGTGPINVPVQGIGEWQANPTPGADYGSDTLLVSMRPAFIGTPTFGYASDFEGQTLRNFAPGVGWIAHEAVHRWAAHLQFRSLRSGQVEALFGDGCRCHWSEYLHAPVVYPVWSGFSSEPYPEKSLMGGNVWRDNGDGTFTHDDARVWPSGLSALDLYVMGLIPPTEVPDTFLLTDVQDTGTYGTVRATKVPVRIEDIVAALGPRVPAADTAQREFKIGIYLLHENGRPPRADLLQRARNIVPAISEYFAMATGGRMRVVPTVGATLENPQPHSFQSGLGVISGWVCEAEEIVIELNGTPVPAAYGTPRADTQARCGDTNNGFGLLVNWNNLGDGEHIVRALADGVEFANTTVQVRTFGTDFLENVRRTVVVSDFPYSGDETTLQWEESLQNFVITDGRPRQGGGYTHVAGLGARLENPSLGSSQSGIRIISGWACEAEEIVIELAGTPVPAAYGTPRADTRSVCGDTNNGFGLLVNWNNLGDGEHTVRALVDGVEFATTTVRVRTFGTDFLEDVQRTVVVSDFPRPGDETPLQWEESLQNFVILP